MTKYFAISDVRVINLRGVRTLEGEDEPPILTNPHCPISAKIALQSV